MYNENFVENKKTRMKDLSTFAVIFVFVFIFVYFAQYLISILMTLLKVTNLLNSNIIELSQSLSMYFDILSQQIAIKSKQKSMKKVEKKIESQFLMKMFNLMTNVYDTLMLIRQLLRENKIDLN